MNIQDTGIRGYLKWLQQDQPGIYAAIAPHLAQQVPEAFSDYEQSRSMGSLMGLSDSGITYTYDDSGSTFDPNTPTYIAPTSPDVANAANSGASTPAITSSLANMLAAATQGYLAKTQIDNLKAINNIQLQRAQLNLAPLDTSSLSLGIPQINVGVSKGVMTGGGIALAVVGGLGVLWLLSGKGRGGGRRYAMA